MIYEIYVDDKILYYPNDEIYAVDNAVLKEEVNTAGYLEFDVYPTNPEYDSFTLQTTYVSVKRNTTQEIFYGRVMEIETDLDGKRHIYARGILAELYDCLAPEGRYKFDPNASRGVNAFTKLFEQYMRFHSCRHKQTHISVTLDINSNATGNFYFKKVVDEATVYRARVTQSGRYIIDSNSVWFSGNITSAAGEDDIPEFKVSDWSYTNEDTNLNWAQVSSAVSSLDNCVNPLDIVKDSGFTGSFNFRAWPFAHIQNGNHEVGNYYQQVFTGYKDIMTEFKEKLFDVVGTVMELGGIDYKHHLYALYSRKLSTGGPRCNQPVEKGRNMLSFKSNIQSANIVTYLVPYAKGSGDDEYLTINSAEQLSPPTSPVYHGYDQNYIWSLELESKYGRIERAVEFSDVETADDLLSKAVDWFVTQNSEYEYIEVTALDLSCIDSSLKPFDIGYNVRIINDDLGDSGEVWLPITAKTTYINDLSKSQIAVGGKITRNLTTQVNSKFSMLS